MIDYDKAFDTLFTVQCTVTIAVHAPSLGTHQSAGIWKDIFWSFTHVLRYWRSSVWLIMIKPSIRYLRYIVPTQLPCLHVTRHTSERWNWKRHYESFHSCSHNDISHDNACTCHKQVNIIAYDACLEFLFQELCVQRAVKGCDIIILNIWSVRKNIYIYTSYTFIPQRDW